MSSLLLRAPIMSIVGQDCRCHIARSATYEKAGRLRVIAKGDMHITPGLLHHGSRPSCRRFD